MVDEEVEMVLREIRERVISQAHAEQLQSVSGPSDGNGDGDRAIIRRDEAEASSAAELARISGYLTTTARAWDRLPPVISNRSGFASRLELRIKARLKSLARWFTWEQVNFNAAVHHALRDTLEVLSHQQAALASLRTQLQHETESRQLELQTQQAEAAALRAEVRDQVIAKVNSLLAELHAESEARRTDFQNLRTEVRTMRAELHGDAEARRIEIEDHQKNLRAALETYQRNEALRQQAEDVRRSELIAELRQRDDLIENEQRVSFKQLSLESSESAAHHNHSQRKIESTLGELAQRIKQLEELLKRGT